MEENYTVYIGSIDLYSMYVSPARFIKNNKEDFL